MELKKLAVLGGLCAVSYQAAAHPGHSDSLWEEIVHTFTAADHLPLILVVAVVLVTGALLWKRRR
jgi:hydrogenase/urease accessory protein HupE